MSTPQAQPGPPRDILIFSEHPPDGSWTLEELGSHAVVTRDGRRVELSGPLWMCLRTLVAAKLAADDHECDGHGGFVRSENLVPAEHHVGASESAAELIRRLRWLLASIGLADLITAEPAKGYRVRALPGALR